jgi:hypothetical protein
VSKEKLKKVPEFISRELGTFTKNSENSFGKRKKKNLKNLSWVDKYIKYLSTI